MTSIILFGRTMSLTHDKELPLKSTYIKQIKNQLTTDDNRNSFFNLDKLQGAFGKLSKKNTSLTIRPRFEMRLKIHPKISCKIQIKINYKN